MDEQQSTAKQTSSAPLTPEPDFDDVYANNSRFEISAWDLKIHFGQLDQSSGQATVDWNTAITVPWTQAKLLSYFLQLNIAIYEAENGKIQLPRGIVPPPPEPPVGELAENPAANAVFKLAQKLHQEIF
ncbi:MAG: DUF3467 domain-containing protein [Acidobacteria bacterium]|nr:DUF3467 domain-containing protein [Acidobacteriota bacterium]